eukprot:12428804-Alexandrium_andersonii.AAC.1
MSRSPTQCPGTVLVTVLIAGCAANSSEPSERSLRNSVTLRTRADTFRPCVLLKRRQRGSLPIRGGGWPGPPASMPICP